MENNKAPLTTDERLEYEEIGRFARHDIDVVMEAAKVMLPISLGLVPVAAAKPDLAWPIGFASVLLYFNYCSMADTHMKTYAWRLDRANDIERDAGLDHHQKISRRFAEENWLIVRLRPKYVRWMMLMLLIGAYCWIGVSS